MSYNILYSIFITNLLLRSQTSCRILDLFSQSDHVRCYCRAIRESCLSYAVSQGPACLNKQFPIGNPCLHIYNTNRGLGLYWIRGTLDKEERLTVWCGVRYICCQWTNNHWFRQWLVAWPAPGHILKRCVRIVLVNNILIEIHTFWFSKFHLKISSWKWWRFILSLNASKEIMSQFHKPFVVSAFICLLLLLRIWLHTNDSLWRGREDILNACSYAPIPSVVSECKFHWRQKYNFKC